MTDAEIERAITEAVKKHLRDNRLHDALAWLKSRADTYKRLERLG